MAPNESERAAARRLKIEVVDDEEVIRRGLRLLLERDYDVFEAATVSESLTVFDQHQPDLITLDIVMPDIGGMEALQMYHQRSPGIPVVLISGHATFKLAQEALRLGATDYLAKPFTATELYRTIKSALSRRTPQAIVSDPSKDSGQARLNIPLLEVQENHFLSPRHQALFLAFAQNVLSSRKRAQERVAVHELLKTITLQCEVLRLETPVACEINEEEAQRQLDCDMYLLGGGLANLLFLCLLETRGDKTPFRLRLTCDGDKLHLIYEKGSARLSKDIVARFNAWHEDSAIPVDARTAMVILGENAVKQHQGKLTVSASSEPGALFELTLPLSPKSP